WRPGRRSPRSRTSSSRSSTRPPRCAPSPRTSAPTRSTTASPRDSEVTGRAPGRSWSGTVDYGPGPLHAPASVDELQQLVAGSSRRRALGTRHSFSEVAASDGPLVTLADMPLKIDIDTAARTVRVSAGVRYGELALAAHAAGLALPNMGSLPHLPAAGARATGPPGPRTR